MNILFSGPSLVFLTTCSLLIGCASEQMPASGSGGSSQSGNGDGSGGVSGEGSGGSAPASGGALVSSGGNSGDAGGAPSGGSSGSGGGDGQLGAGCDASDLLLCDDFEGSAIDTALWTVGKNNENVVELSNAYAAHGQQSIHIHAGSGYGYLKNTSIFPVPDNHYFGRMFIRMERYSTVDWAHWTLVEAEGTGDGSKIRVGGQYRTDLSENRYGVGSDGGPTGDWTQHDEDPNGSPMEPKTKEWVCIEWEHDGSADETRMFIDGELHPSLSTTASQHGGSSDVPYVLPELTSVWVGFWQYQTDPEPFDLWIDAVAFDDERVGCN